jgi:hypothetical protein
MSRYVFGYGNVHETGFVAFAHDIAEGEWKEVSLAGYDTPERRLPPDSLQIPPEVAWKLRAAWAIGGLRDALGKSPEVLAELDTDWDGTQRKLYHLIGGAAEDRDPAIRAAAERLRIALLEGNGVAQTNRTYDAEVDFGRRQVELMTNGTLKADVELLGLAGMRDQVHEVTEALARGLGRAPGEQRTGTRRERIRAARTACATAFNGIHSEIAWFLEHTPPGAVRSRIERLLAPFKALLARYPAPAATEQVETEEAEPSPAASPAPSPSPAVAPAVA